jgi:hypothetical protein
MASERQRLVELALESLERKKKAIDEEIEHLQRLLKGGRTGSAGRKSSQAGGKQTRYAESERQQRSERMKLYWVNWRKRNKNKE